MAKKSHSNLLMSSRGVGSKSEAKIRIGRNISSRTAMSQAGYLPPINDPYGGASSYSGYNGKIPKKGIRTSLTLYEA